MDIKRTFVRWAAAVLIVFCILTVSFIIFLNTTGERVNLPTQKDPTDNPTVPALEPLENDYSVVYTYDLEDGVPVIDLKIGTPAQTMAFIYDTASFVTNVACDPCMSQSCVYETRYPAFHTIRSSTYRLIGCDDPECTCYDNEEFICPHECLKHPSSDASLLQTPPSTKKRKFSVVIELDLPGYGHVSMSNVLPNPQRSPRSDSSEMGSKEWNDNSNMRLSNGFLQTGRSNLRSLVQSSYYCGSEVLYLDGTSASGPFMADTISMGNVAFNNFQPFNYSMIMCDFEYDMPGINGILGAALNAYEVKDMIPQAFMKNAGYTRDLIGVCSAEEQKGGIITFGGYDERYFNNPNEPIKWVELNQFSHHYLIYVTSLSYLSSKTEQPYQFVWDTGTTLSILPQKFLNKIITEMRDIYRKHGGILYIETYEDFNYIVFVGPNPEAIFTETFKFYNNFDTEPFLSIPPSNMFRYIDESVYTLTAVFFEQDDIFIIGSLQTRNNYVLLDNDAYNLAFVPSKCPHFTPTGS